MTSEDVRCFENIGRLSVYLFENNRNFKSAAGAHLPTEGRLNFSPPQSYSQKTLRIKTNCLNHDCQDYRIDRIIKNDKAAGTRMESLYPLLSQVWLTCDRQYSGITNHFIYLLILRFQPQYNYDRAGVTS